MARRSRPPGFDMTYRPVGRAAFGPPLREQLPATIYFGFALVLCAVILYGQHAAPPSSALFQYVVEGDRGRLLSSSACAIVFFVSGLAAVLREQMRGVVVHPDGVEMREVFALSMPRVRRFHWSQIDRLKLPTRESTKTSIGLDLWDGSSAWLPKVARPLELAMVLETVAMARAIPIEGGGLVDDLVDAGDDEDEGVESERAPRRPTRAARRR